MTLVGTAPAQMAATPVTHPAPPWFAEAVIYEVHVRAFQDSDADGIGDFRGLVSRLDYLQELGVTAVWLLPFYPSPLRDDGYDISDYRGVHPSYGTLRDFRAFLREAHRRGLRVITELVLAHTSDEHQWFQRARRAPENSPERDYYVWSDTPDRFAETRVIFKDFEASNWTYDRVAGAYFWHRFYSHQPSLNYDNPLVRAEIFGVVDHWLEMGVDGLRLDAVPYLYAREGTTCENLPETFAFLRELRSHVDDRFRDRMLLAEANQWPMDAAAYMGGGDACHMAFHFPLMPRMFMAARQEDRFPVVDILADTPQAPPGCQWALFLRNHDELTLEMVTDEERDYMYRVYAQDPQARVNVGIRRRLAPLMGNDRSLIEMMNVLLFSLPGTPILYYGDEIGMGDNIYLGDRDSVRTPMQWDGDRNAGFSRANPQRLFLPMITDPAYHAQAVNVEAQQENPGSLLWWMRRLIAQRNRYKAFSIGTLELLFPENRKVLAFLRRYEDQTLLVVVNLSRFAQAVELDLSSLCGATPVELFGASEFPPIGDLPYFVTLGPHGFYWFSLESDGDSRDLGPTPEIAVDGQWDQAFSGRALMQLESLLPGYLAARRWFAGKSARIAEVELFEAVPIHPDTGPRRASEPPLGVLALMGVELSDGTSSTYVLPLAYVPPERAEELRRFRPEAVVCDLDVSPDESAGALIDAVWDPEVDRALFTAISRRRQIRGHAGRLVGVPSPALRRLSPDLDAVTPVPMSADQSNTSITFGDRAITKLLRRVEPGVHPGVEVTRALGERTRFAHSPLSGGSLEYRREGAGNQPMTVALVEEYVANEGDGWHFVVDTLIRGLEELVAVGDEPVDAGDEERAEMLVGPHLEWSALLGRRTAEMHAALASLDDDPAFAPEPLTSVDRRAMVHAARGTARLALRAVRAASEVDPIAAEVVARENEIMSRLDRLASRAVQTVRIRCHGDYHLGQVLWTGKDFVLVDFDGEPQRSLSSRRLKRTALVDVAGMIRSFHYARSVALAHLTRSLTSSVEPAELDPWLMTWDRVVTQRFFDAYLAVPRKAETVPGDPADALALLEFLLLEKALYELGYEANNRPDWIQIPARGILELIGSPS